MKKETIKTSENAWFKKMAKYYKKRIPFEIIDDGNVNINPVFDTLLEMGKKADISPKELVGVLIALGTSSFGAFMIRSAILDPEPTSKLGLMVISGALLVVTGGITAIRILTGLKPPKVTVNKNGFTVEWE